MKNKVNLFGIIVFITVIGFAVTACDNDIKPDVDVVGATLKLYDMPVTIEAGADECTATDFAFIYGEPLSTFISGTPEVNLVNGKLTIKLDAPKPEAMFTLFDYFYDYGVAIADPGIVATSPLDEIFCLAFYEFHDSEREYFLEFVKMDIESKVHLIYVDKNVTINGTTEESSFDDVFNNVILYKGWNYLIDAMDGQNIIFTSTRNEPNGYNWTLFY